MVVRNNKGVYSSDKNSKKSSWLSVSLPRLCAGCLQGTPSFRTMTQAQRIAFSGVLSFYRGAICGEEMSGLRA